MGEELVKALIALLVFILIFCIFIFFGEKMRTPQDDMKCIEGHDEYNPRASSSFVCDKWAPRD